MATKTKAKIIYGGDLKSQITANRSFQTDDIVNEVVFHAVISEDHSVTSKITKYPVQTGFEVSNHAIKQNRRINLEVTFTNTVLNGSGMIVYSSNNSKKMFEVLQSLVQASTVCKLITNLGVYYPLVFNKFSTKQEAGMMDSVKVLLTGEEIQVSENIVNSTPVDLSFINIPEDEIGAVDIDRSLVGKPFTDRTKRKSTFTLGSNFSYVSRDVTGRPVKNIYKRVGFDPVTGKHLYEVHTDNTDVIEPIDVVSNEEGVIGELLSCLDDDSSELTTLLHKRTQEEFIHTQYGRLARSREGVLQAIIQLGGSDVDGGYDSELITAGLDCLSVSKEGEVGEFLQQDIVDATISPNDALDAAIDAVVYLGSKGDVKSVITAVESAFVGPMFDEGELI